jgi:asparagine synthase (glutamine-hydrolysing)
VEYAARLPDRTKIRGRQLKWVLKQAVRDIVPASILHRGKMGFGIPLPEWLRGPWRPLLEDRLLVPGAQVHEWVRPDAVERMARMHLAGGADFAHQLWALITLDAWLTRQRRMREEADGG